MSKLYFGRLSKQTNVFTSEFQMTVVLDTATPGHKIISPLAGNPKAEAEIRV